MAYTPKLNFYQSCTLRRIAWALEMPMTKAMNEIMDYVSNVIDRKKICKACRDKSRCFTCTFYQNEEK